eukprot:TRINITY_DN7547_c0_g3_i1.p2 TRINITY_DN7547_c0_g3~~TRINITY_DN7547_c0_g3_i1.p2  ORF type:complete len:299 (-),score=69.29 TRINITY_DN7547_c0_g3_i1:58-954(-)
MGFGDMVWAAIDWYFSLLFEFPFFDVYFVGRPINMLTALWAGVLRLMSGEFIAKGLKDCKRPARPLKLYEFEGCPFCRKVREAVCVLDLDVEMYPCPKPSSEVGAAESRFRGHVQREDGGKTTYPVLFDENLAAPMIRGSEEIVAHLWKEYGATAEAPMNYTVARKMDKIMPLFMFPSLLRLRFACGIRQAPSVAPAKPLILWGHEASPFVKIVREALTCLELPYVYKTVPIGSEQKRKEFADKYGAKMSQKSLRQGAGVIQIPMVVDPNKSEEPIFESAAIVKYLYATYGKAALKDK